MAEGKDYQPIYILPEGSTRDHGRSAQKSNILAAKLVAETIRTTLGPKGMDKMLVDSAGALTITNDGVTILEEMEIVHPSARMVVEVAKTQEFEVGDGTTTAVVLAGELLKNAEVLLDSNVHPTILAKGYRLASERALQILGKIAFPVTSKDTSDLKKIAITAMTGKGAEAAKDVLGDIVVEAVLRVDDKEDIRLQKQVGGLTDDSELIEGIVIDKEKAHSEMAMVVKDAKIALIDSAIEVRAPDTQAKIQITDPSQLESFIDREEKIIRDMVKGIVESGCNVLFCQKGIDDIALHLLAKEGILAARRVKKSDMISIAKATGGKVASNIKDLVLGNAGAVEQKLIGDEQMIMIKDCKNPKAITLLIKGATIHIVDEIKRAMEDAIGDLSAALKTGKLVAGAGAPEMEVAKGLRKYADTLIGREQLAVRAFAESLEIIPKTLAENAGMDPIDIMTELKAAHEKGELWAGLDIYTGKVVDSKKEGILEPLKIKTQAISSASEVAEMILRIDDVITCGKVE